MKSPAKCVYCGDVVRTKKGTEDDWVSDRSGLMLCTKRPGKPGTDELCHVPCPFTPQEKFVRAWEAFVHPIREWIDLWFPVIGLVLLIAGVIAGLLGFAFFVEKKSCERHGQALGVPYRYDVFGGCLLQVDGRWTPEDNVRFVQQVSR